MSIYDELLLSDSQLAEVKKGQQAFMAAHAAGDQKGMKDAHQYVEKIRNTAGYSGGQDGSTYRLLQLSDSPEGYSGYEKLVNQYANGGMNSIAAGYQNTLQELAKERERIQKEGEEQQTNARSAAWNTQRLAQEGLLTRGMENTGLSDIITASALNQAAANAYQALLDRDQNLRQADLKAIDAKADALAQAGELQKDLASLLTEGYADFYQKQAERDFKGKSDQQDHRQEMELNEIKFQQKKELDQQDYQQELALAKLAQKYDIDLSKLTAEQKRQLAEQEYQYDLAIAKLKRQWEKEDQKWKR